LRVAAGGTKAGMFARLVAVHGLILEYAWLLYWEPMRAPILAVLLRTVPAAQPAIFECVVGWRTALLKSECGPRATLTRDLKLLR
jgi:hypothetical protein